MTAALMDGAVPKTVRQDRSKAHARSDRAPASCQREQLIAHQMQTHRLGELFLDSERRPPDQVVVSS